MSVESLQPTERRLVMDLVRDAGVDVSDWANYANGHKSPAANPRYCYEWAFVQKPDIIVLNVWYREIRAEQDDLVLKGNLRDVGARATESGKSVRGRRAESFDQAVQHAHALGIPVRTIICDGQRQTSGNPSPSRVQNRMLDPQPWFVRSYDSESGEFVLVRGSAKPGVVDQFIIGADERLSAGRRVISGTVYVRRPEVRLAVLERAGGNCEWCNTPGFRLPDNRIYLETHHVIPLSESGPDTVSNVVALCPNHHREAHFGMSRDRMRARLLEIAARDLVASTE